MHEIYLVKVPETVDLLTQTAPIAIMTRSPQKNPKLYYLSLYLLPLNNQLLIIRFIVKIYYIINRLINELSYFLQTKKAVPRFYNFNYSILPNRKSMSQKHL